MQLDPLKKYKNILVKMPNWLGDIVMATPVLEDLKQKFPSASITAMCRTPVASVLSNHPSLKEIYEYTIINGWVRKYSPPEMIQELRRGKYDLGILLTHSFSSAWWLWRANIPVRIGFAKNFRTPLLTHPIPYPLDVTTQHQIDVYKQLLLPLEIPLSSTKPKLYFSEKETKELPHILPSLGIDTSKTIIIGIHPGATYGSAKCWLPERFRLLIQKLLKNEKMTIILLGDGSQKEFIQTISKGLPPRVINLAGRTSIRELMMIIQNCHVFLSNDSGPMHVAAALDVPVVSLFGSTSAQRTGPYSNPHHFVIAKQVECSPCYKRTCPIDFRCMKQIEVEEVYQMIQNLITSL